jgi:hypothetical protein
MVAAAGVMALAASAAAEGPGAGEEAFSADETNMRCIAGSILAMTASMISSAEAPVAISAAGALSPLSGADAIGAMMSPQSAKVWAQ